MNSDNSGGKYRYIEKMGKGYIGPSQTDMPSPNNVEKLTWEGGSDNHILKKTMETNQRPIEPIIG